MPSGRYVPTGRRDLRVDWLRGLAMTCVIVNHSRLSSLLSWFSYERLWVVTAAEVFVVLSGIVLGMVYGHRLARDGWRAVVRGLARRAAILYVAFIAVTISLLVVSLAGIDISSLTTWDEEAAQWFLDPRTMTGASWLDVVLMRHGSWTFQIVGLYVWLVAAAVPCLITLRVAGWRPLLAGSWALYLLYQVVPYRLTGSDFESAFPILAWQLLFVHGLAIGYYRRQIGELAARLPRLVPLSACAVSAMFVMFALCNPRGDGPTWLHWHLVSAERFSALYARYFALGSLGVGRLLNLAVGLPLAYVLLTRCWALLTPFHMIFLTLGQQSLAAFVLHVYGLLLLEHLPYASAFWMNTFAQVTLVVAIAALLNAVKRVRAREAATPPRAQPLAA